MSDPIRLAWIEHPKNQTVTAGDIVLLRCRVQNPAGKVVWYKDKKLLFHNNRTEPNSRITNFPRHHYIGDESKGENDLEIIRIHPEDAGIYECHATAPGHNKHKELLWPAEVIVTPQELATPLMHQSASVPTSTAAFYDVGSSISSSSRANRNFVRLAPSTASLNASPVIALWLYVILVIVAGLLLVTNAYLLFSLRRRRKARKKNCEQQRQDMSPTIDSRPSLSDSLSASSREASGASGLPTSDTTHNVGPCVCNWSVVAQSQGICDKKDDSPFCYPIFILPDNSLAYK